MLDLNLPPLRFRHLGTPSLYGAWLRLSIFSSGIVTNMAHEEFRRRVADLGGQADIRFQLLTQEPLTLSFGWARAFERDLAPREEWMVSLKVL